MENSPKKSLWFPWRANEIQIFDAQKETEKGSKDGWCSVKMEKPGQALGRALCALASTQDLEGGTTGTVLSYWECDFRNHQTSHNPSHTPIKKPTSRPLKLSHSGNFPGLSIHYVISPGTIMTRISAPSDITSKPKAVSGKMQQNGDSDA